MNGYNVRRFIHSHVRSHTHTHTLLDTHKHTLLLFLLLHMAFPSSEEGVLVVDGSWRPRSIPLFSLHCF